MFSIVGRAIQLWIGNLPLLGTLVLTIWLPGHLLVGWSYYSGWEESSEWDVFRMTALIEAICSPIYAGAIVFALPRLIEGKPVPYGEALGVGFQFWGRLFAARFVAGLLILVGLVAFLIPGLVLSVRYALIDATVVLENQGVTSSRERSWSLTDGRGWQIFGAITIVYLLYLTLATAVYTPLVIAEEFWALDLVVYFAVEVVLDCLLDIVYTVNVIVMFLFYWEASGRSEENAIDEPTADTGGDEVGQSAPSAPAQADDLNPYRPPSA